MSDSRMSMGNPEVVIQSQGLSKTYDEGPQVTPVLRQVDLTVLAGEKVAVVGASGSGKSTLLHLLGGLDTPTEGQVFVCGKNMTRLGDADRGRLRNNVLGFIYQFHHLLPEFTAVENVSMPLMIRGLPTRQCLEKAEYLLDRVGLSHRLKHKPGELSGGERQRVAICRALINQPRAVLADEPTGNLDRRTAGHINELLTSLNEELSTSIVVVTHDPELAEMMDRVYNLEDGALTGSAE